MALVLQCWSSWGRCVLLFDQFEFFSVFHRPYIIHLAQFVQLTQGQASFTQVTQLGLTVVLARVLIAWVGAAVDFIKYHDVFISVALRQRCRLRVALLHLVAVRVHLAQHRVVLDLA